MLGNFFCFYYSFCYTGAVGWCKRWPF